MKSASRDAVLNSVPAQMLSTILAPTYCMRKVVARMAMPKQDWSRAEAAILGTGFGG
jgi:hypothetical protein